MNEYRRVVGFFSNADWYFLKNKYKRESLTFFDETWMDLAKQLLDDEIVDSGLIQNF